MFKEAVERFHQLDHCDVRAVVDELMIRIGSVGPAPSVGEGVELRLAYLPARFAKQDVVIGVRIKWRIEINETDTLIGKFFPIRKPFQIVAEIQPIHLEETPRDLTRSSPDSLAATYAAQPSMSLVPLTPFLTSPQGCGAAGDFPPS